MKTFNNDWNYDLNKLPNINEIIILDLDKNEITFDYERYWLNKNKSFIVESIEDYERGDYKLYYINLIQKIDSIEFKKALPLSHNEIIEEINNSHHLKINKNGEIIFSYQIFITNRPENKLWTITK